jgi:multiple sugar transport system substrate-binding protein
MQPESKRLRNVFGKGGLQRGHHVRLACRLGILLILGMVTGCASRPAETTQQARRNEGLEFEVACPDDRTAAILDRFANSWGSRSGAKVKQIRYDPTDASDRLPPAELCVIPAATMPSWAVQGKLEPVPAALTESSYAWRDLLSLYRSKLLVWDSTPYALPLLDQPWLCFYRTDLLNDPELRAAFPAETGRQLSPPETWEDYAAIAAYFNQKARPGVPGRFPSLPPLPAADEMLDHEFYLFAVAYARKASREDDRARASDVEVFSFHYDLESMMPRIQTAGFQHALDVLKNLQKFRPPGTSPEPATSFERGEAVFCLAGPAWISRFEKSQAVRGKFGFCTPPGAEEVFDYRSANVVRVPGGNTVPYQGAETFVLVVPRGSPHADAAFDFAAFLSDPRNSRDLVIEPSWGGGPFREQHLAPGAGWQSFELSAEWTATLEMVLRSQLADPRVRNPLLRLRVPDERRHRQALDEELRHALFDGKSSAAALEAAASRWRSLDEGKDKKALLRDYRLSMGLSRGE